MHETPLRDRPYSLQALVEIRMKGRMGIPCRSVDILRQEPLMLEELGHTLFEEYGLSPDALLYRGNGHQALVLHAGGGASRKNFSLDRA